MNSKFIIITVLVCFMLETSYSQTPVNSNTTGKTWAVIVGVSKYKNLSVMHQLNYADADALLFYNYLTACTQEPENLRLFLNENATKDRIMLNLREIIEDQAVAGDRLYVYFAGHGDADKTIEEGYLLCYNVEISTTNAYDANNDALELGDLKKYISAANRKGINVILVTDACRSGKIISLDGALTTNNVLNKSWGTDIKLISCTAEQLSYEGPEYGYGHGIFTYYLIRDLLGEADTNSDNNVSVMELSEILKNQVSDATKDKFYGRQIPEVSGDGALSISKTDTSLSKRLSKDPQLLIANLTSKNSSPEHILFRNLDANTKTMMLSFLNSINCRKLMKPVFLPVSEEYAVIKPFHNIENKDSKILTYSYNNRNNVIMTFGSESKIKIWDIDSFSLEKEIPMPKTEIKCFTGLSNNYFAAGDKTGKIEIFRFSDFKNIKTIKTNNSELSSLCFTPNDKYIISSGKSHKLEIFDIETGTLIKSLKKLKGSVTEIQFSPDGNYIASVCSDKTISIWDGNSYDFLFSMEKHAQMIKSIVFSPDSRFLYSIDGENVLLCWDLQMKGTKSEAISTNYNSVKNLQISNDGKYLMICGSGKNNANFFDIKKKVAVNVADSSDINKTLTRFINNSNSKIFEINIDGSISVKHLTLPIPYAVDIYENLMQLAEITPIKSVLRTSLSVALQQNTDDVILPIMKGSDKQPFPNEIKEVSRYIKYIGKEYPKDSLITNKLKAKLLFLDAYNILYSNSFEKYDSAVIYLNEILQFEPNASYPYNGLNLVYKKKNELEKAKNASTVAVNSSPKWTEPKAGLGKVYLKAGKYSLAIDEFNKIIKLNPEISKGYVNLADVQTTLGNYVEAEKLLDKAVKVDSLNPYIYSKIGHLNFLRGRFDDAEDFFNLSLRLDSANELAHNYLGKLNAEKYICFSNKIHYLKKSHYHYEKALKTNPSPENIVNYAKICLTSIEYVGYTEFYNQICENKRGFDSKEGTYNTLNLLLNKALNQNPYLEDAFLTLALNDLILKSDAKSGESNLIKAVKLCKQFPVSSYNYGIYLELLTNQTGAAAKFEESLKTDAKYFPAYIELFQIYGKLDMDKKLDELYQRALKNFENCALINYHYSLALFDLKQYDKAKKYSQQSVSEDTMNAEAYTTLQNMLKINRIRGLGRTNISNKYSKEIQANYQYIKIIDNKILVSVDSVEYVAEITGRIKTPYFYEPLGTFNDKYVLVQTFTGKKGLTDTDKKIIVNPEFEEINFIEGTTILVTQNNKMGCFNTSGEVVVPLIYWKITDGTYDGKRCICGRKYQNSEKRDFYDYSGNVLAKDM